MLSIIHYLVYPVRTEMQVKLVDVLQMFYRNIELLNYGMWQNNL